MVNSDVDDNVDSESVLMLMSMLMKQKKLKFKKKTHRKLIRVYFFKNIYRRVGLQSKKSKNPKTHKTYSRFDLKPFLKKKGK